MWNPSKTVAFDNPDVFGFHMNVATIDLPEAAAVAIVQPATPWEVFANQDTALLLFVDEAEAMELMPKLWLPDEPTE